MNIPVDALSGTPFTDFTIPALLLGVVVGGSALIGAAIAVLGAARYDALASALAGCLTICYLTVEIAMIGLVAWPQVVWFLVGLVMIGLAGRLWHAEAYAGGMRASHQPV